jgi:hypothetical protein
MKQSKSFLGLAALLSAIIALVLTGCPNGAGGNIPEVGTQVTSVKVISPTESGVVQGGTLTFTAIVSGTGNLTVTWTVIDSAGTTILDNANSTTDTPTGGVLTLVADENASYLIVTATSTVDTTKKDMAVVTIATGISPGQITASLTALGELSSVLKYLGAINTSTTHIVVLNIPDPISTQDSNASGVWATINNIVKNAKKNVILDISNCNVSGNTIGGAASPINNHFNIIKDNPYIKGVVLPATLTDIGVSTFFDCSGLNSVSIPTTVTSIGNNAFFGCTGLSDVNFETTSGTPSSNITSIGEKAFFGCSGLISVNIPDSVTSIGNNAFSGCVNLNSVSIPATVTSIGVSTFSGCTGLNSVNFETTSSNITSIGEKAFFGCTSLTSVTIPNSVTSIGASAFSGCSGLTSVNIPDSATVISIGNNAFSGCTDLSSVNIPNSVTSIGSGAFSGCNLISVTFETGSNISGAWSDDTFRSSSSTASTLWDAYNTNDRPGTYRYNDSTGWTKNPTS